MRRLQPPPQDAIRAAIASLARRSAQLRHLHRLHAVLLVCLDHSCYAVAQWLGEDPRTVERWVRVCSSRGIDSLAAQHGGGRPARLTVAQERELIEQLAAEPSGERELPESRSGKALAQYIESRYGVRLSERQCQRLIARAARLQS